MTASLLPIPDDPRFPALIAAWPMRPIGLGVQTPYATRSQWLGDFERLLREFYPLREQRLTHIDGAARGPVPPRARAGRSLSAVLRRAVNYYNEKAK